MKAQIQTTSECQWLMRAECGSCPVHPGNNVNTGEVTINYTIKGCGEGKCNRSKGTHKMEDYKVAP